MVVPALETLSASDIDSDIVTVVVPTLDVLSVSAIVSDSLLSASLEILS